jgi:hypothetical protein
MIQVSENYQDLKKFEVQAPQLLLSIREIVLKIIISMKKLQNLKKPEYLSELKKQDHKKQRPQCEYFFEMECGQGNILDLIREGRFLNLSYQITGSRRL